MKKEMLINVLQPEECRIAIVEDGVLEELYVERTSQESYVGNIYKGRIVNIEPSIQAAFVDFGIGRNGFLHVSDVEPAYYRHLLEPRSRSNGDRGERRSERGNGQPSPSEEAVRQESESPAPSAEQQAAPPAVEEAGLGENLSRSRGRKRSRATTAVEVSPTPTLQEGPSAEQPTKPPTAADDAADRSLFMDSAEHRTEDKVEAPSPATEPIRDEDIFFPRPPATDLPSPQAVQVSAPPQARHEVPDEADEEARSQDFAETLTELESSEEVADQARPDAEQEFDTELEDFNAEQLDEFEPRRPERRRRGRRDDDRRGGRRGGRRGAARVGLGRPKPLIQDIFKRGQEVLVQVIKEGIGTKGPTLSTYISIAGRYLVLMPGLNRIGVSRKIEDEEQRRRLRDILHELQPPKGLGFIIRTAGLDRTKKELQRDLAYLSRLWQVVVRRIRKLKSPAEIYQESDMITRTIRDTFTNEIDSITVDEPTAFEHAQEFLQIVMPRYASRINLYQGPEPLFHKYGIEDEIARIQQRHVPLPNGGSIVIDQTEALVAIDVNSGNFRADNNAEETAYQMNLQAAKEIARQLRLRDLGGVIVNDFIDMREEKHRRDVERALREAVRRDRARTKILKMSQFGIIEMTRQRIRPSLKRSVYQDCPHCLGLGQVKTCESMSIEVMRLLQLAAHRTSIRHIQVKVHEDVANYLHNKKRKEICRLEETGQISVTIHGVAGAPPELLEFNCYDVNNNEVKLLAQDEPRARRR